MHCTVHLKGRRKEVRKPFRANGPRRLRLMWITEEQRCLNRIGSLGAVIEPQVMDDDEAGVKRDVRRPRRQVHRPRLRKLHAEAWQATRR
jgi:hypothetical protein